MHATRIGGAADLSTPKESCSCPRRSARAGRKSFQSACSSLCFNRTHRKAAPADSGSQLAAADNLDAIDELPFSSSSSARAALPLTCCFRRTVTALYRAGLKPDLKPAPEVAVGGRLALVHEGEDGTGIEHVRAYARAIRSAPHTMRAQAPRGVTMLPALALTRARASFGTAFASTHANHCATAVVCPFRDRLSLVKRMKKTLVLVCVSSVGSSHCRFARELTARLSCRFPVPLPARMC